MSRGVRRSPRQYVLNSPVLRLARELPGVRPAPFPRYIEPLFATPSDHFDPLHLDTFDLRGAPPIGRTDVLRALLADLDPASPIKFSEHLEGCGAEVYRKACSRFSSGEKQDYELDRPCVRG